MSIHGLRMSASHEPGLDRTAWSAVLFYKSPILTSNRLESRSLGFLMLGCPSQQTFEESTVRKILDLYLALPFPFYCPVCLSALAPGEASRHACPRVKGILGETLMGCASVPPFVS